MDLRRLRAGEWIVALSGVALLVSLFLPWYDGKGTKQSAWNAFAVNDAILAVIAVAAMAQLFVTANQGVPAVPIAFLSIMTLAGALAAFLGSCAVLMLLSWIVLYMPEWKISASETPGVPLKNSIDQSQEFALCVFMLIPLVQLFLRERRMALAALAILIGRLVTQRRPVWAWAGALGAVFLWLLLGFGERAS